MRAIGAISGLAVAGIVTLLATCGPNANAPPSNDEISTAYKAYWGETVASHSKPDFLTFETSDWFRLLTPISATTAGQAITNDSPNGKLYQVNVLFRFRARVDLYYRCSTDIAFQIYGIPIDVFASDSDINISASSGLAHAKKGDVVACPATEVFQKVDQGLLMQLGQYRYLIPR